METLFYIQTNINTPNGPETYGRFELGNDRDAATVIFRQLQGSTDVASNDMLTMELMETAEGLPLNLLMISCTLDELATNCRIISKEVFNLVNLKGGKVEPRAE